VLFPDVFPSQQLVANCILFKPDQTWSAIEVKAKWF